MCHPSTNPAALAPPHTLGPLRPDVFTAVRNFLRCGDLAAGFLRFLCPDCGHEHLLAFTCKDRHFCPSCHQRRVRSTSDWIATAVCHEVPHRQFVFTIPKILRGIFRKRRQFLSHLFHTATETLRDAFRPAWRSPTANSVPSPPSTLLAII